MSLHVYVFGIYIWYCYASLHIYTCIHICSLLLLSSLSTSLVSSSLVTSCSIPPVTTAPLYPSFFSCLSLSLASRAWQTACGGGQISIRKLHWGGLSVWLSLAYRLKGEFEKQAHALGNKLFGSPWHVPCFSRVKSIVHLEHLAQRHDSFWILLGKDYIKILSKSFRTRVNKWRDMMYRCQYNWCILNVRMRDMFW